MSILKDNLVDLASGTVGGLVSTVVGHPLDTVRVRLQAGNSLGMVGGFRQTLATEGMKGLYKGVMSPITGAMFHNAVLFFVYGNTKRLLLKGEDRHLSVPEAFLAGAITGSAAIVVETPMDLLKCKMQLQGQQQGAKQYFFFFPLCLAFFFFSKGIQC